MASLRSTAVGALLLGVAATGARADGVTVPPGFAASEVVRGLVSPTAMTVLDDGRILVCEQKGTLRVVRTESFWRRPSWP